MEYAEENELMRTSQIRPPSRIPSPGKGLAEISESQSNVRSKPASRMPAPASLKHKLGASYAEPDPKRKTLAAKAGETKTAFAPTQASRPTVKGTSLVGATKLLATNGSRINSFSSSISSRPPSVSTRNTSGGSFSSSIGPGNRPASFHGGRPQTSMASSQSTTSRPGSLRPKSRPATAMEIISPEDDISMDRKRQGMQESHSFRSSTQVKQRSTLQFRKLRQPQSRQPEHFISSHICSRDSSLSTAMGRLRIDDNYMTSREKHQAIGTNHSPSWKALPQEQSNTRYSQEMIPNCRDNPLMLYQKHGTGIVVPKRPVQIPVLSKMEAPVSVPVTPSRASNISQARTPYLSKDSNLIGFTEWDLEGRLKFMEAQFGEFKDTVKCSNVERSGFEETQSLYKSRITELEELRSQLSSSNKALQDSLDDMRAKADELQRRLLASTTNLDDQMTAHRVEMDNASREQRNETDKIRREHTIEIERLLRLHRDELRDLERRTDVELKERIRDLERQHDTKFEDERIRRVREVQDLESRIASESHSLDQALQQKDRDIQNMRGEIEDLKGDLDREQTLRTAAQKTLLELKDASQITAVESATFVKSLEASVASLRNRIHFLESGSKAQSDSFAEMESRLQDAIHSAEVSKQKLIKEESLRRILFNQVQELKGNIRVMCRVRPIFDKSENEAAKLTFPDTEKEAKELEVQGKEEKSSLGTISRKTHAFSFDRVFGPGSQNQEVFEEISQLVQSALDGYNVCIFCYGQTGSGKTHTMSSADGMIPRATHQIYETATALKEKGWTYTMEGSFVEVYNEDIHDLLGDSKDFDKKKHEIRHDEKKKQTTVTGLQTVLLDSPESVTTILKRADANRSVAATKSNERSSRSHSIFILKLVGRNSTTGETSEGTLNLVDLAGSERLKQSGAEGDRMKETQNINKSLSCLGDVIGALGQGKEGGHIPYRNSKLTYLLQYSLGGNSKTLMFVMVSPLEAHLSETVTSLKFATKVHNTHIGTAKKSTRA